MRTADTPRNVKAADVIAKQVGPIATILIVVAFAFVCAGSEPGEGVDGVIGNGTDMVNLVEPNEQGATSRWGNEARPIAGVETRSLPRFAGSCVL
jgi:hypothetical protein|tara:strand:- start:1022 stop:1306 length:285 start_codon:yes stop_codon:yes gene_type:complete